MRRLRTTVVHASRNTCTRRLINYQQTVRLGYSIIPKDDPPPRHHECYPPGITAAGEVYLSPASIKLESANILRAIGTSPGATDRANSGPHDNQILQLCRI